MANMHHSTQRLLINNIIIGPNPRFKDNTRLDLKDVRLLPQLRFVQYSLINNN